MIEELAVDEAKIPELVAVFYSRVRQDAELGPIFNKAITDWPHHLLKLADFWSSVMLATGKYKGNPMAAHMKHQAEIAPAHFDRWLSLWRVATAEVMGEQIAEAFQQKADRIAESLKLALFFKTAGSARADRRRNGVLDPG